MSDTDKPTPNENGEAAEQPVKKINGGRNLIILGLAAIAVAVTTSGISLWIYRQNDIYLDRSRPGFISDGEENEDIKIDKFSEEGEISKEVLDKYLEEFDYVQGKVDGLSNAFSTEALDDKNFLYDDEEETVDDSETLDYEDAS